MYNNINNNIGHIRAVVYIGLLNYNHNLCVCSCSRELEKICNSGNNSEEAVAAKKMLNELKESAHPGFAVVFDNIDMEIQTKNMTMSNQNSSHHWVNHKMVINYGGLEGTATLFLSATFFLIRDFYFIRDFFFNPRLFFTVP